ncbi:Inosine triphosphate pyrophosphatase [Camponotus floridanus]|uniref:Inosine triphosphate pyrophosphatase n=1 Tax=Camponotus floridanus TaxID=104421 RepID=E2A9P4_CAMFO|nr:inosine triphosphate pyrophosphatase [Camponotus floridanus]XP_011254036.1 inosine triphosphate pyrophosphatase [Camponotus floridanus]EFN69846.1 Inosine triphosphate pyrophosphatase [Camponotus floridanus]
MSKPVVFVTSNPKKLEEFTAILGQKYSQRITNMNLYLPEYQGEINEVCRKKCQTAAQMLNGPAIIEDTSLCFNAMKGLPGPYIKWFLERLGPEGLYKMLDGWEDKSAEAVCTFAYCSGTDARVFIFQGRTQGTIVSPRGPREFGWDPCFQPRGYDQTYAELPSDVKNQISHRYKALEIFKDFLINNII